MRKLILLLSIALAFYVGYNFIKNGTSLLNNNDIDPIENVVPAKRIEKIETGKENTPVIQKRFSKFISKQYESTLPQNLVDLTKELMESFHSNQFGDLSIFLRADSIQLFKRTIVYKNEKTYRILDKINNVGDLRVTKEYTSYNYPSFKGQNYFHPSGFGGGTVSQTGKGNYVVTIQENDNNPNGNLLWFEYSLINKKINLVEIGEWKLSE